MTTHIDFILNQNKKISITVPDISSKFTYFYESTENLHKFDEATVYFFSENNRIEIEKETLDDILFSLNGTLREALSNKLSLPKTIKAGLVGYAFNFSLKDLTYFLDKCWVWGPRGISTLIYNADNKIYLEIVPTYPWVYVGPKPGDNYVTFDEFMNTYKPYAVEIIPYTTALQWLNKSKEYLKLIGCEPYNPKTDKKK